ncbi:hypothetical protein GCM10023258_18030 [Terrabacter aeriphilus]|uniref:Uncharacterized protein n=1 Tax=Terrabacter aeriphilus TaxID=515662 RepID=A0ABP9J9P1_9MICO
MPKRVITASPAYVLAALDVPEPEGLETLEPDEPDEPLEPDALASAAGSWPAESEEDADEEPEADPVLSEVLLVVVTWRVSAATTGAELREVL